MKSFDFSNARYLFTDVDDTLTTDGQLLPETYAALWRLAEAGIAIVPVTGGCAGWCDQIIRTWPVRAVVGEGGGFYASREGQGRVDRRFWVNEEAHRADQAAIFRAVQALDFDFEVKFAKDQPFRLVDVAIDYNQDCKLTEGQVQQVVAALVNHGFRVKRSSIHLNIIQGDFDKCTMTRRLSAELFGLTEPELKAQAIFVGDAPNDESMFEFFPQSVGVANIIPHLGQLGSHPACLTKNRCGLGFAELVEDWLTSVSAGLPVEQC